MTDLLGPIPSIEEIGVPIVAPVEDTQSDLIDGLVPKAGQLMIAGETNVGKSLVALEIVSALTTGFPLWGSLTPNEQCNRVLYVLGEHYNEVIQRLWQKTQLPMSDNVWLIGPDKLASDKWLVSGGRPNMIALEKFKRWADGTDLVVFDPLAAFVTGENVENDNAIMRMVLDQMSLVAQNSGAACLVVAHKGKPTPDKFGQEHSRKRYAIRGASAIEDAATNVFYMNAEEGNNQFSLIKRKYKGEAPNKYDLYRNPDTLTHTILGAKPNTDAKRHTAERLYGRLSSRFPDMTAGSIHEVMATVMEVDERTVRRHLGLDKS